MPFIRSQKRDSLGIPTLRTEDMNKQKDQSLNDQLCSVYSTADPSSALPDKGPSPYTPLKDLSAGISGVTKRLQLLTPNKASGPDVKYQQGY